MSVLYTKIHKSFRDELKGYGKSFSEIEKGCDLMLKTLGKLYNKIPSFVHTEYNGVYSDIFGIIFGANIFCFRIMWWQHKLF